MSADRILLDKCRDMFNDILEDPFDTEDGMRDLRNEIDLYLEMTANVIELGDTVIFGTKTGEKTKGKVVKINQKTYNLELLEIRGKNGRYPIGTPWRVAKAMCEKC
jgi:hypothetical protein